MRTIKAIIKFLLVQRSETTNKWWHRMVLVLLLGSGIFVSVVVTFLNMDTSHSWVSYRPTLFSLEQGYSTAKGKEILCEDDLFAFKVSSNEPVKNGEGITCKGVFLSKVDSKRYVDLYNSKSEELRKKFGLDKYDSSSCTDENHFTSFACVREKIDAEMADPVYDQYQDALKDFLHIKVVRIIEFQTLISDVGLWVFTFLLTLVIWILFWSSIVYRAILYIVFGKSK